MALFKNMFSSASSVSSNGSVIGPQDTSSYAFGARPKTGSERDSNRSQSSNYSQRRANGASGYKKNDWYAQKAAWKAHKTERWNNSMRHAVTEHDPEEIPQCTLNRSNVSAWNAAF